MSDQTALEEYRDAAEAIRIQVAPRSWSSRAILALWDALEAAQAREEADDEALQEMGIHPAEILFPSIRPLEYKAMRKRVLREAIERRLAASGTAEGPPADSTSQTKGE